MADLTRRVKAPAQFTHAWHSTNVNQLPANVEMRCSWNGETGEYQIDELTITPISASSPISSQLIRKLQIASLLERASRSHLILHARVDSAAGFISTSRAMDNFHENLRDSLRAAGIRSGETLEWVALIYELASVEGSKPTQAVSEAFDVSLRTASNWVRAAREAGVLSDG